MLSCTVAALTAAESVVTAVLSAGLAAVVSALTESPWATVSTGAVCSGEAVESLVTAVAGELVLSAGVSQMSSWAKPKTVSRLPMVNIFQIVVIVLRKLPKRVQLRKISKKRENRRFCALFFSNI